MEPSLTDTFLAISRDIGSFLFGILASIPPLLVNPRFIGTFLFFTLVIWIGMSGEDREPVSSFSKAGLIAFIAAAFMFIVIEG